MVRSLQFRYVPAIDGQKLYYAWSLVNTHSSNILQLFLIDTHESENAQL
jgi:hypothetical protein